METVAFDLDGTLVGYWPTEKGLVAKLRPLAEKWIRDARSTGARVILWTFATRDWYEEMADQFPILREFDKVYTREDLMNHVTRTEGYPRVVKDVRKLDVDLLIDNDPKHAEWASRYGLSERYLTVPTFGEM